MRACGLILSAWVQIAQLDGDCSVLSVLAQSYLSSLPNYYFLSGLSFKEKAWPTMEGDGVKGDGGRPQDQEEQYLQNHFLRKR